MANVVEVRITKSVDIDIDVLKVYLGRHSPSEQQRYLDTFDKLSQGEELARYSSPNDKDKDELFSLLLYIAEGVSDDGEEIEVKAIN